MRTATLSQPPSPLDSDLESDHSVEMTSSAKGAMAGMDATTKDAHTAPLLHLSSSVVGCSLRATSGYVQSQHVGERPPALAWPVAALALQAAHPRDALEYDLLILGVHASLTSRHTGKHCLYVAVLPHLPEPQEEESSPSPTPIGLSRRNTESSSQQTSSRPPPSVKIHSSYGEFPATSNSSSSIGPGARLINRIYGRSRRNRSCTAVLARVANALMRPLSTLSMLADLFRSSAGGPPRPLRHFPKLPSLADAGVSLVESAWPWKTSSFFGLELVWADDDNEWLATETMGKERAFSTASCSAPPHRLLPVHPSHICIDPTSGELILTDHERHSVYSVLPCWLVRQKLADLTQVQPIVVGGADDATSSSSVAESTAWSLPLADVLLDIVVGYVGNQVRLLAGEANVKGCRDGRSTDATFNAPNGVAVHPRTGHLFITDGHWNSRICELAPNTIGGGGSASTLSDSTRWNVASVPLHPCTQSSESTWFSAVRHFGPRYTDTPSLWPLRLPTAPLVLTGASSSSSDMNSVSSSATDALVLLDEELHLLRAIPLAGEREGQIATITGYMGAQGNGDGWSTDARFLFPQALIAVRHPLASRAVRSASRAARALSMRGRHAILVADTGNDRICLVTLVSRGEVRLERRKQRMLRRQMKALAAAAAKDQDESEQAESDSTDSESDSDAEDNGPLVGHVESIPVRGLAPPDLAAHFIPMPWTPWSDMRAAVDATRPVPNDTPTNHSNVSSRTLSSPHATDDASSLPSPGPATASTPAALPPSTATVLPPASYVHRGQNTYPRKLCVTSQHRVIALNRIGLTCMEWTQHAREQE